MRGFLILCFASVALAAPQGYSYQNAGLTGTLQYASAQPNVQYPAAHYYQQETPAAALPAAPVELVQQPAQTVQLQQAPVVQTLQVQQPLAHTVQVQHAPLAQTVQVEHAPLAQTVQVQQAPLTQTVQAQHAPLVQTVQVHQAPLAQTVQIQEAPAAQTVQIQQAPLAQAVQIQQAPLAQTVQIQATPIASTVAIQEAPVLQNELVQESAPIVEYTKEFFFHSAPEDLLEEPLSAGQEQAILKKNLHVVFIKAPENNGLTKAALQLARQASEDKTAIYVLSKQHDLSELSNQLRQVQETIPAKPEVHFVKYRTAEDAEEAQRAIQSQYDSFEGPSHVSNEGAAPVISYVGSIEAPSVGSAVLETGTTHQSVVLEQTAEASYPQAINPAQIFGASNAAQSNYLEQTAEATYPQAINPAQIFGVSNAAQSNYLPPLTTY